MYRKMYTRLFNAVTDALEEMERVASESVGNKVSIHHTPKNKGKVEIRYHSVEELEKIIDVLKGGVNIG